MGINCIYCKRPVNSVVGMDRWHRSCREEFQGDLVLVGKLIRDIIIMAVFSTFLIWMVWKVVT